MVVRDGRVSETESNRRDKVEFDESKATFGLLEP